MHSFVAYLLYFIHTVKGEIIFGELIPPEFDKYILKESRVIHVKDTVSWSVPLFASSPLLQHSTSIIFANYIQVVLCNYDVFAQPCHYQRSRCASLSLATFALACYLLTHTIGHGPTPCSTHPASGWYGLPVYFLSFHFAVCFARCPNTHNRGCAEKYTSYDGYLFRGILNFQ